MSKKTTSFSLFFIVVILFTTVSARPAKQQALSREKRQSDQRLAELETLLALQKYGRHRFRMDRKKGVGAEGEHPPGYGIIDFRMLGRKKKSTRFSPGELENSVKEMSLVAAAENNSKQLQENQQSPFWGSENKNINDIPSEDAYPENPQPGDIDQQFSSSSSSPLVLPALQRSTAMTRFNFEAFARVAIAKIMVTAILVVWPH